MAESDVVLLVPRRADGDRRDRLFSFCRAWWAKHFPPDWTVFEGFHERGPFNRSAAVNRAADLAGEWTVAVVMDGDVLPSPPAMLAAVEIARADRPVVAFDHRLHLTRETSDRVLDGYRGNWHLDGMVKDDLMNSVSGAFAVSRNLFDAVGGFDELFVGWGWEDVAFSIACEAISGSPTVRVVGDLYHLWHPNSPENSKEVSTFRKNRARGRRYIANRTNRREIEKLVDEGRRARAPLPRRVPATSSPTRIPKILHRTVPADTTEEVELFWKRAAELHPGFELRTWRDPLDPLEWPETADLWDSCTSGAQLAGLIRLEALWRDGGIYLDSDVELYRPLDSLLDVEAFAGWEDSKTVPDAVLGSRPKHPAFAIMLERARKAVVEDRGAWYSGPGVTTATLPGRRDVLLLPPGSFYPYHYTEKHRRDEDHAAAHPYAFGAHHWAASWLPA